MYRQIVSDFLPFQRAISETKGESIMQFEQKHLQYSKSYNQPSPVVIQTEGAPWSKPFLGQRIYTVAW